MKVYYPEFYHQFKCIAGDCPDSCCKDWAVDVDPEAAAYYRGLSGALGDRLRQVLKENEDGAYMETENGRCPMWREDGLCRIQAEHGHDALCKVCREFPRISHDYGDFQEFGLELSCPEAAKFIMSATSANMVCRDVPGGEAPEYDTHWMDILFHCRKVFLKFLDEGSLPLPQTLAIFLLYGYQVQEELDGGEAAVLPDVDSLEKLKKHTGSGDMTAIVRFFENLEILTPQWKERLAHSPGNRPWDDALRPFLRYGILRYWLQAVSDGDLVCRVKFLVVSTLLIHHLGGDPIETAQLFSKEIENDPDNVDALLDACYMESAMSDLNLLSLLLN